MSPSAFRRTHRARRAGLLGASGLAALAAGLLSTAPASAVDYVPAANGALWSVNDATAPGVDTGSIRSVDSTTSLTSADNSLLG